MISAASNQHVKNRGWLGFMFIIWPFFSFILAVKKFEIKSYRIFVILFFAFFGYTQALNHEGSDGYRHLQEFRHTATISWDEYISQMDQIIERKSTQELDIYTTTVDFFFSRFSDSFQLLFFLHGLFYAFMCVKVYGWIVDEFRVEMKGNALMYMVLLLVLNNITRLPYLRFPLATWMYIIGAYQYLKFMRPKHLVWCGAAVLIHFSFVLPCVVIGIFMIAKRANTYYIIVLLISIFFPDLLHNYLIAFDSSVVGEGFQKKIAGYGDDDYINHRDSLLEATNWYRKYKNDVLKYTYLISFLGIKKELYERMDNFQKNLFSFLILFLAYTNFGYSFSSLGLRSFLIWMILASVFLIRYYQFNYPGQRKLNVIPIIVLPGVIFSVIMEMRLAAESATIFWFIGNPLSATIIPIEQSIWDILK